MTNELKNPVVVYPTDLLKQPGVKTTKSGFDGVTPLRATTGNS